MDPHERIQLLEKRLRTLSDTLRAFAEATSDAPPVVAPRVLTGNETILLVEDQEEVRRVAHRILTRFGYHVIDVAQRGRCAAHL